MGPLARFALIAWVGAALCTGCSLEKGAKGDACTRTTQCAAGLACIRPKGDAQAKEGKCSADISSLYDPSQVPVLMPDAGVQAQDAGADGAAAGDDAGA